MASTAEQGTGGEGASSTMSGPAIPVVRKTSGLAIALGAAQPPPREQCPPSTLKVDTSLPPTSLSAKDGVSDSVVAPLVVRTASNGAVHLVHLHTAATVEEFKEVLQRTDGAGGVPAKDQILIVGSLDGPSDGPHHDPHALCAYAPLGRRNVGPFVRLSSTGGRTVRSYPPLTNVGADRGADRAIVYMFDRRVLSSRAQPPPVVVLEPQHVAIPEELPDDDDDGDSSGAVSTSLGTVSPTKQRRPSSTSSGDPLLAAVDAAERQFRLHYLQGKAWADGGRARLRACAACLLHAHIQIECLDAAVENLGSFFKSIAKEFRAFWEVVTAERAADAAILASFPEDLEFLKRMTLHKNLVQGGSDPKETLYDCCPVDRLQHWAQDCARLDVGLDQKLDHLNALFQSVQSSVGAEVNGRGRAKFAAPLDNLMSALRAVFADVQPKMDATLAVLEDRHARLQNVLAQEQPPADLLSIVQDLGKQREEHLGTLLPAMAREVDDTLSSFMEQCADLKNEAALAQHHGLRKVSKLQAAISELKQKQQSLQQVLKAQHTRVSQLLPMKKMPSAYAACLAEVARRRAHRAMVVAEVRAVAKKMSKLRSEEIERREAFLRRHGCFLPADLVPGLSNPRPAAVEIGLRSMSPDEALPDIDVDETAAKLYEDLGLSELLTTAKLEYPPLGRSETSAKEPSSSSDTVESLSFSNAALRAELMSRFAVDTGRRRSFSGAGSGPGQ
jgi:hypothetical protein